MDAAISVVYVGKKMRGSPPSQLANVSQLPCNLSSERARQWTTFAVGKAGLPPLLSVRTVFRNLWSVVRVSSFVITWAQYLFHSR
jgi:hypothetical protein